MDTGSSELNNDNKSSNLTVDYNNKAFHRRNTVAECCTDKDVDQTLSSSSSYSLSKENNGKIKNEDLKLERSNQLLMDIYIKTSSGNVTPSKQFSSMHELKQNLTQLFDKKQAIVSSDKGKTTENKTDDDDEEFEEDDDDIDENDDNHCKLITTSTLKQEHITAVQTRHRLFRRIRKSLKPYKTSGNVTGIELLINNDSNNVNDNTIVDNKEQPTGATINKSRQLWNFAIQKQIQLLKQEQNREKLAELKRANDNAECQINVPNQNNDRNENGIN